MNRLGDDGLSTHYAAGGFCVAAKLSNIPFWGWGLRYMSPIAINPRIRREALRKIRKQGRQRLQEGFVVVVFPEGTRMAPNERRDYHPGGAWFAKQAGVPIVPVSVNSGRCWPKGSFLSVPDNHRQYWSGVFGDIHDDIGN